MFWGFTPAQDLLQHYLELNKELPSVSEFYILLIGGVDSRHILKTLAKRYKHENIKINFYVAEASVETVAKQLLLLNIALQDPEKFGLVRMARFFMELYGNTLVRPAVAKFLTTISEELLKMVTDYNYLSEMMPSVSLDVKYKERDFLENLLKFWCGSDEFNICDSWDRRLRKFLGARYDSRLGAFDWDLNMRLHSIGAKQICTQEYRSFRVNGVSFYWLESEVSKPNRSMVCVVIPNGEKFAHYGYLGDMQTGPFVSFGLSCEDEKFLKSSNGQNAYRATDVTERNLCEIFHEIHYQTEYKHKSTSDIQLGPVFINMGEKKVIDIKQTSGYNNDSKSEINKCIELDGVKIKFISISLLEVMKFRTEYKNIFNFVYFGNCYLKFLNKELIDNIARDNAVIMIENQKFVVNYRDKQLKEFEVEIKKTMEPINVKGIPFDPCKDNFAKFVKI